MTTSFTDIGLHLGVSKQAARLIYAKAMKRVVDNVTDEDMVDIWNMLEDKQPCLYESMIEKMCNDWNVGEDMRGFWNERNA